MSYYLSSARRMHSFDYRYNEKGTIYLEARKLPPQQQTNGSCIVRFGYDEWSAVPKRG